MSADDQLLAQLRARLADVSARIAPLQEEARALAKMIGLLERALPSPTEDATMGVMSASAISPIDANFRRIRGQAPKGGGPFDAVSARTGLSLRQIAIRLNMSPNTVKSINRRVAEDKSELPPALKAELAKLVASVEKEKKKK